MSYQTTQKASCLKQIYPDQYEQEMSEETGVENMSLVHRNLVSTEVRLSMQVNPEVDGSERILEDAQPFKLASTKV